VAGVVAVLLAALVLGLGDDRPPFAVDPERIASEAGGADDPLDFSEERAETLAARAALGTSHPIYAKSPDGVVASAERTAQWRELVERAAARWRVDADTLEAMVLLESAGRPEVMADGTPHSATGLTQITPSAATELLGMRVDLERSTELTERIARAAERGRTQLALRLARERSEEHTSELQSREKLV